MSLSGKSRNETVNTFHSSQDKTKFLGIGYVLRPCYLLVLCITVPLIFAIQLYWTTFIPPTLCALFSFHFCKNCTCPDTSLHLGIFADHSPLPTRPGSDNPLVGFIKIKRQKWPSPSMADGPCKPLCGLTPHRPTSLAKSPWNLQPGTLGLEPPSSCGMFHICLDSPLNIWL